MKKVILTLLSLSTIVSNAGIPVVVDADPQAWTVHLLEEAKFIEQIKLLQDQYDAMFGDREMWNLLNTTYDIDPYNNIDNQKASILENNGIKSSNEYNTLDNDTSDFLDLSADNAAAKLASTQKSLNQVQARFAQLQALINALKGADDPKTVMDLQARISAEQTFLQNDLSKLNLLSEKAKAIKELENQRIRKLSVESSGSLRTFE